MIKNDLLGSCQRAVSERGGYSRMAYASFKFSAYTLWINFSSDFEFI